MEYKKAMFYLNSDQIIASEVNLYLSSERGSPE